MPCVSGPTNGVYAVLWREQQGHTHWKQQPLLLLVCHEQQNTLQNWWKERFQSLPENTLKPGISVKGQRQKQGKHYDRSPRTLTTEIEEHIWGCTYNMFTHTSNLQRLPGHQCCGSGLVLDWIQIWPLNSDQTSSGSYLENITVHFIPLEFVMLHSFFSFHINEFT